MADESVDFPVIERLRADGHDVVAISEYTPGLPDSQVLALAVQMQRILLTGDRDFGDVIMLDLHAAPRQGVVLYRLRYLPTQHKVDIIANVFAQHMGQIADAFTVIQEHKVRHRSLP
ncbi:MAG TPA: DUF5615 family PIN-like protein [Ktedonobacterales bacterium]|nr:DUF5615 family PIN-like protein [Ktedonobacterales bacterium]